MGFKTLTTGAFIGLLIATATSADEPPARPRYALAAGREFSYHTEARSTKAGGRAYLVDWKVWPVGRDPDGSWRLVFRCDLATTSESPKSGPGPERADTLVWRCRLFDDGRLVGATTMGTVRDPFRLFPRLPDGPADLQAGWSSAGPENEGVTLHHHAKPGATAGEGLTITTKADGPEDKVYLMRHESRATFDPGRGAVTRVETEDASEHLTPGAVTRGVIELVAIEDRGADWAKTFGDEADRYFGAVAAYGAADDRAIRDAARCPEILAGAKADLEKARGGLTTPVFLDAIGQKLAGHDRAAKYRATQARERAERLGKAAAAWEAQGLDGTTRRLADYRGKVVVMDFWYRNCGWCIHAMPQLVRLSEAFRDQPVAFVGLTTDKKDEDARAVIDAMALNYPTVRAGDIPQEFGVHVYPTLIVIDQVGKVREIHLGYSPHLFEDLSTLIRGLLAEKAAD